MFSPRGERNTAALFPARPHGLRSDAPSAFRRARLRALVLSVGLGTVASLGALQLIHDLKSRPGIEIATASNRALATRQRALDRMEEQLAAARAKKPPDLPAIPKFAPVPVPKPAAPAVLLVYVPQVTTEYNHDKKKDEKLKREEEKRREEAKKREERRKREEQKRREEAKKRQEEHG